MAGGGREWSIELCPRFVNASGFRSVCFFNGNWLPSFPLFVTLSYETEAWSAIRAISLVVVVPPPPRPSPPFDILWLRQIFVQISLSCGLPQLHKLLKIYCACRALAGSPWLSLSPPLLSYSYVHREQLYILVYLPISKYMLLTYK